MSAKLKKKGWIMIGIEIICLILLGIFLSVVQTNLVIRDEKKDIVEKMDQVNGWMETYKKESQETIKSFDEFYQSKAESLAWAAQKSAGFECTNSKMQEYKQLLNVNNVLILDRTGNVLAQAQDSTADFTKARFNELRTTFTKKTVSAPFEVKTGGQRYRYYGCMIDRFHMVVLEQSPQELDYLLESTDTWKGRLENVSIGLKGYAFAVSAREYTVLYHPDETLIGKDSLDMGLKVENLEDKQISWMNINGEKMYCGVVRAEDTYVLLAVSEEELMASRNISVAIILFVFFAVMTLVIAYAFFLMADKEKKGDLAENLQNGKKKYSFDKAMGSKISVISAVGLIAILLISFYLQTIFELSRYSMSINQNLREVQITLNRNAEEIDFIKEQYNTRYLNKCRFVANVLEEKPELANKEDLSDLCTVLNIHGIYVFDNTGLATASNSPHQNFRISSDPEDQSYEFNVMLEGAEYFIQELQRNEISGEYYQYFAVALKDKDGKSNGFVQVEVSAKRLANMLWMTEMASVLDGVQVGVHGFAFAINKEDKTFSYYPSEDMIYLNCLDYGIQEEQLRSGFSGYLKIGGRSLYASSVEKDNNYIYVAMPVEELSGQRFPITVMTGIFSAVSLTILCLILSLRRHDEETDKNPDHLQESQRVEVITAGGHRKYTEAVSSRWDISFIPWRNKTPEQKMLEILKWIITAMAAGVCVAVLLKNQLFTSESLIVYVLNGEWQRGINVFSITCALFTVCVLATVSAIIRKILMILANVFGARGETVCRLINSFVKYVAVLIMLYYTLAFFGVDTAAILASAGILTLVVGMGSKSLVADIIAGLFIIFEGEFRVGDIVTVGDWRGTVIDIGVRTTKIEDGGKNVKIISNSSINGVVNMTRDHSYAFCEIGIEYGESLERVEAILEKEFPNIAEHLPDIIDGPFYQGVISLGDNSVNIRIAVQCEESKRIPMARALNREMKLIFDKHNISIPFPQVVLNQPPEFIEATAWEKYKAEKFRKEQQDASKDIKDGN